MERHIKLAWNYTLSEMHLELYFLNIVHLLSLNADMQQISDMAGLPGLYTISQLLILFSVLFTTSPSPVS